MEFNLDVRLKQLESLDQYISSSRDKVQSVLDCLKWSANEVLKESQLTTCTIDHSHRVSVKKLDDHLEKCSIKKQGYDLTEAFLSEPQRDSKSSIYIDNHKKIEVLTAAHGSVPEFKTAWNGVDLDPKTSNRLLSTFSSDERLALYNYAIKNTGGVPQLPEFNTVKPAKEEDKELSIEEIRKRERDARRRRIKYKSVHTNRKSHKEVLQEVIEGQMEQYREWLVDNGIVKEEPKPIEKESYERDHSVVSRNSTRSGSSRSTRRSREHYRDDRSSSRKRSRKRERSRESRNRDSSRRHERSYRNDKRHDHHHKTKSVEFSH